MITEKEKLKKMTKKEIKEAYALDYTFSQDLRNYEDYLTEDEMDEIALTLQYYDVQLLSDEEIDRLFYYCSLSEKDPEYKGYQVEIDNYDKDVRRIIHSYDNCGKKIVFIHCDEYEFHGKKALGYLYVYKKEKYSHIFQNVNIDLREEEDEEDLELEADLEAIGNDIINQSSNEFNFTNSYIVVVIYE